MTSNYTVTVLGLGAMGLPMATRLASQLTVHGFDIAVPLRRRLEVPTHVAADVAARVRSQDGTRMNRVFRKLPLVTYRLVATDVDWSVGEGPEIRGPVVSLLLLLTGRQVGLDEATGDGADALRRELVPA